METSLVDSNRLAGNDDVATVHSLRSLVSYDESSTHSLERHDTILSTDHCRSFRNCEDYSHHYAARSSGAEMSIIACSSPEIKALVQPIPPSIQFQHHRSVSTLTLFPEYINEDDCSDSYYVPVTKMTRIDSPVKLPTVSPIHGNVEVNNNIKLKDRQRLSIEHREQENSHSEDHFIFDDNPDVMKVDFEHGDETDELALCLERQGIGSNRIDLPEVPNKELRDSSNTKTTFARERLIEKRPLRNPERPLKRRSSRHRRVSYDSLPDMSEILRQPELPSTKGRLLRTISR